MKKALVHKERICEFADIGQEFPVNPELTWVDVADDTTTQDTWDGTQVVKHVPHVPDYAELRREAYASWGDQLDMQYWDGLNSTTVWSDHIADVKASYSKP